MAQTVPHMSRSRPQSILGPSGRDNKMPQRANSQRLDTPHTKREDGTRRGRIFKSEAEQRNVVVTANTTLLEIRNFRLGLQL